MIAICNNDEIKSYLLNSNAMKNKGVVNKKKQPTSFIYNQSSINIDSIPSDASQIENFSCKNKK